MRLPRPNLGPRVPDVVTPVHSDISFDLAADHHSEEVKIHERVRKYNEISWGVATVIDVLGTVSTPLIETDIDVIHSPHPGKYRVTQWALRRAKGPNRGFDIATYGEGGHSHNPRADVFFGQEKTTGWVIKLEDGILNRAKEYNKRVRSAIRTHDIIIEKPVPGRPLRSWKGGMEKFDSDELPTGAMKPARIAVSSTGGDLSWAPYGDKAIEGHTAIDPAGNPDNIMHQAYALKKIGVDLIKYAEGIGKINGDDHERVPLIAALQRLHPAEYARLQDIFNSKVPPKPGTTAKPPLLP